MEKIGYIAEARDGMGRKGKMVAMKYSREGRCKEKNSQVKGNESLEAVSFVTDDHQCLCLLWTETNNSDE